MRELLLVKYSRKTLGCISLNLHIKKNHRRIYIVLIDCNYGDGIRLYICTCKRRAAFDILNRIRIVYATERDYRGSILITGFDEIQNFSFISRRFSYRSSHRCQNREHSDTFEDYVSFQHG